MPLDPMMAGPMLDPFRNMMADVDGKGLQGPAVDEMREHMQTMERLAQEMSDIAAFSGQLAQLGTFQKFSDAYGRALAQAAASSQSAQPSDDEMFQNTLRAYRDTLASYQRGEAGDDGKRLIPYLERMVAIGESGISYPVFLRKIEEEGLSRVLEGAAPALRPRLVEALETARAQWAPPFKVAAIRNRLAIFDDMASKAPFGQPDPLEFSLAERAIDWELDPLGARWDGVVRQWEMLFEELVDWLDSFTSFAPHDERWKPPGVVDPAVVRRNIERTQECGPGDFRWREQLLGWYFQMTWSDIWTHETFVHNYSSNWVTWSDDRLHLIAATYAHCVPGGKPPQELVQRAESLHPHGDRRPEWGKYPSPEAGLRHFMPQG
jgi:hypothetical protein